MSLLSEIANRLGYFDDAEFLLEKAVEFKPNDGDLRMKYATILRKKQKFAKTMEQVNIYAINTQIIIIIKLIKQVKLCKMEVMRKQ